MEKSLCRMSLLLSTLILPGLSSAQTLIYSQVVNNQNFLTNQLFQVTDGTVTPIQTGLRSNFQPSLSQDGRYLTLAGPDPLFPNEASDDLWEYDRDTGQLRKIIDNNTVTTANGSIFFTSPLFSARSPNNQIVIVSDQTGATPGGPLPRQLKVYRVSDGFDLALVEFGNDDLFRSDFLGISWSPDGLVFATSGGVAVTSNRGTLTASIGIIIYGFNPATNTYQRLRQLTFPRVFEQLFPIAIVSETHVFPVFSPDGRKIAFFAVTYPDPLIKGPATTELYTVDINGANLHKVITFNPGFFPAGLSWSPDGSRLAFSIAQQIKNSNGFYSPLFDPSTAVLRTIDALGGTPTPIPGAAFGFYPLFVDDAPPSESKQIPFAGPWAENVLLISLVVIALVANHIRSRRLS